MLQAIRDNTRGWIAYVIVAVLIVPFALFGVYNYFTGGSNPPVAEVAGHEITSQQLDRAVQQQRRRLQQMLGDQYDPSMFGDGVLRRRALDNLIDSTVLDSYAREHGLRLTDAALRRQIRSQQAFQANGEFSQQRYQAVLRQNGMTPEQYEARLRQQGATGQLRQGVTGSVIVTDEQLARFVALQRQQRNVAWLRVDAAAFRDQVSVDGDTLREYYDAHTDAWQRPQQVRLAYVSLSRDELAASIDVSDQAVRKRYESERDSRFVQGGERQVQHILVQVPDDASRDDVEAARKRVADLRERIVGGDIDFAAAAREYSDDTGSADDGGSLGWVARGDLSEPMAKAAFSLDEGAVSEPVRTDFGWHLIRVSDVREREVKPFEAVRDTLRKEIASEKAEQRYAEVRNEFANVAYENPQSLEPAAEAAGVAVQTTDWVSRQGGDDGITSNQSVMEAAFSKNVLDDGMNSELIKLGDNRSVVVRIADQRPATTLPFDEVRDQVRERFVSEHTATLARERGEALENKLADGTTAEDLAAGGGGVDYKAFGWVGRDGGGGLPRAVTDRLFRMAHPGDGGTTRAGVSLADGDYAVVLLSGVRDGSLDDVPDAQREQLRQRLGQLDAASVGSALVEALRAETDVTIYEDRL
ncbi:Peptidyl-prolyl cis-trans isomerase D [wastewater metagenome]|uniref:Periplasmic chaperone PpiD n=2 Tax=unclassified sequences TaxID=12908 RepID=A0A5B8R8L3_9ZZZZ|nr:SurA N-terminal domain-containing protein [Arhodomonas sp. KWT]QEA04861.1 peptidyl-prolyl cis-trans isomerase D [uncultured organism]